MSNSTISSVGKVSQAEAIGLVERLVKIQSPTSDLESLNQVTAEAQKIMTELLGTSGEIKNLNGFPLLTWKSGQPKVLLLCHLDTVWPKDSFDPLWKVEGDQMHGPGVYDMKAGFVQALIATASLSDKDGIYILATTDEEEGSFASRAFIEESAKLCNHVLVFESAINGKLKISRKGTSMYRISVKGRASHAGLEPEKGINAALELALLLPKIVSIADTKLGTTVTPTVFTSGTTLNTVPALAQVDIDVRGFTKEEQERVDREINSLAGQLPSMAEVIVTGGINRPALDPKMSEDLFKVAQRAALHLGLAPIEGASVGGASDGNFTAAAGIPTLDGLGAVGDGAHAAHEWASALALMERSALVQVMLEELLK